MRNWKDNKYYIPVIKVKLASPPFEDGTIHKNKETVYVPYCVV